MRTGVALSATSAVLLAWPALAQGERESQTGSHIGRAKAADAPTDVAMSGADRARVTMEQFADCTVTAEPRRAVTYRDMKYDDPKSEGALRSITSGDCLTQGQLAMPSDLLRGAIFKTYYRREVKAGDLPFQSQPVDFADYLLDRSAPTSVRYLILMDFGGCVVRAAPTEARAFLLASAGSRGEATALDTLRPHLGPCLPSGLNVTFNKSMISAVLAEALYREAKNQAPASGKAVQ